MIYRVEIEKEAEKSIENIRDRTLQKDINNKIRQLRHNPSKGKHLFSNYYELKAKNYRVYYAVFKGIIIIENVQYDGKINVHKVGTKDSQRRDIDSLD